MPGASPEDLIARLEALGIQVSTIRHPAVNTVEEARRHCAGLAGVHSKNLFFKDAGGKLWLVVVPDDRVLDLKTLHTRIGAKRLSFGPADKMQEALGVTPGSVTPFALINDREHVVSVVLDAWMMGQELLNFHPLVNTATATIRAGDLLKFIRACGHEPAIVALD